MLLTRGRLLVAAAAISWSLSGFFLKAPAIPELTTPKGPLSPKAALLLQVVGTCCINETMSAAVLGEMTPAATAAASLARTALAAPRYDKR